MIAIAWASLILWPVVVIILFRRLSLPLALSISVVGGYLLLPVNFGLDLPVLPVLNKHSITALVAAAMTFAMAKGAGTLPGILPRDRVTQVLLAILIFGTFGTILTNSDGLSYGPMYLPGLRPYDAFSILMSTIIVVLPLFLARKLLATPEAQRSLLVVLAVAAGIYTIPTLWEVRMSPQLHNQLYGFATFQFGQSVRGGGFRPVVFTGHGLSLAIFLTFAILASAALSRIDGAQQRGRWIAAVVWLMLVLVLAKSLGALMIAILFLPVVFFLRARTQALIAACIAGIVLTFPLLRSADLIPIDRVVSIANSIDPLRAASLEFRLDNEEELLEKARERMVFGWGSWSRNRVFDANGRDISVTDGSWIIELGTGGLLRYVAVFGLLSWPIIALFVKGREAVDPVSAALALILCGKLIDLIPNSDLILGVNWIIAGALLGRIEMNARAGQGASVAPTQTPTGPARPATRYSRTPPTPGRVAQVNPYARKPQTPN